MACKRPDGPTDRKQQKAAGVPKTAGHGAKSQAVRDKAILALLSEKNIPRAAAKCGVCERTLHKWLSQDEAFQVDYAAARQATFEAGMSRVQALTGKAIDTLDDLLDATDSPNVRLGAARTVTELGIHGTPLGDDLARDVEGAERDRGKDLS